MATESVLAFVVCLVALGAMAYAVYRVTAVAKPPPSFSEKFLRDVLDRALDIAKVDLNAKRIEAEAAAPKPETPKNIAMPIHIPAGRFATDDDVLVNHADNIG